MRARLTYQDFEGKTITAELSSDAPATIGRSRDNTIVLRDEHASRMHCRIHFDRDQWWIRDFGLNGSKINGSRIDQEAALRHGDEVRIGDTRMRFVELDAAVNGPTTKRIAAPSRVDPPPSARLQHDDLTVLCNYMAAAVRETTTQGLLRTSLDVVLHQTSASLVGFLSDDPNNPVTKMVTPETGKVDPQLSKSLIKRVQRDGGPVWLCSDITETATDDRPPMSSDALCLPVRTAVGRSLGTLHLFRQKGYFTERDLRFCEALVIHLGNALHMLRRQRALEADNRRLHGRSPTSEDLVGDGDKLRALRATIAEVAQRATAALIIGERGVGKELIALNLHRRSSVASGPFVTVDCTTTPAALFEAELFGCRKGALGASEADRDGLLLDADDGTLFLDEIGDLPAECQAKLVRVLEGRPYKQLGGTEDIYVNVHIVASTSRDLAAEVGAGRFRDDLLAKLALITINVPPLRDHREDVPMLAQYYLDRYGAPRRRQLRLTDAAVDKLRGYNWPGNVRQLRACLESAAALATGDLLDSCDFHFESIPSEPADLPLDLERLEAWAVREALKKSNGNKTRAAQLLGIGRDAVYAKIERYGLDRDA